MTTINDILYSFLKGKKLAKDHYDDLKIVVETCISMNATEERMTDVLKFFRFLQDNETRGWRPKQVTEGITERLLRQDTYGIELYALFCPSYKKGIGAHGFRTDGVGETTKWGLAELKRFSEKMKKLGFEVNPRVIFFDLAIEQPDKSMSELEDLDQNIKNFTKETLKHFEYAPEILSLSYPMLRDVVGRQGVKLDPLPVPQVVFDRIVERGRKFYELFGWSEEQILERSKVIASSEALVGYQLRESFPNGIMFYTPTMLERAMVYCGQRLSDPIPMIFPKHE